MWRDDLSLSFIKEKMNGENSKIIDYFRLQFSNEKQRAFKLARDKYLNLIERTLKSDIYYK
jgi:hypothetical protein